MPRKSLPRVLSCAALLLFAAAACAGSTGGEAAHEPTPAAGSVDGRVPVEPAGAGAGGTTADARTAEEIEALWLARLDSARMHFTEADVAFVTGMIHHHAQALDMTALAETRAASPAIRTLAARITNAQRDEIALMERWLEDRGQPVPHPLPFRPGGHATDEHLHAPHMPGMLTPVEMAYLAESSGEAFDRLFLELMIRHHRGAIVMVHELFATDGAAQDDAVFKLASDVQVDQATEVDRMERMLEAMSDGTP